MKDLIERQDALDAICDNCDTVEASCPHYPCGRYVAVEKLHSAQPERLTDDDFETIRIHLNAYKEKLCNQGRWKEAVKYQNIIDRFMAFASAQPESQWIPVAERLPEIKQRVLITYNTEDGLKTDVTWYDKYGFLLSGDVTAWMPMVEPYKEESGE